MINYKKTYKESTSWRHWRLSCSLLIIYIAVTPCILYFNCYVVVGQEPWQLVLNTICKTITDLK